MRVRAAATAVAGLALTAQCAGSAPRIVDRCDLASVSARAAHVVRMPTGSLYSEAVRVGARVFQVSGVRLRARESVSVRMASAGTHGALIIRLATPPDDYGKVQRFRVDLDGRAVCSVRETDPGAGPWRSVLIPVDGEGAHQVRITGEQGTAAPTIVANLQTLSTEPRVPDLGRARMALALLSSQQLGYGMDRAEIVRLHGLIPRDPLLDAQVAVLYNFSVRTPEQNAAEIRRLADLVRETAIPLRVAFQFHWAGVPSGVPDGAGGTYTDLPYQMVTFDPAQKVDDPELASLIGSRYDPRFGRTVPNIWGNTPWLTFNHPRLNEFRRRRLRSVISAWWRAREGLAAEGKAALLPGELSTGEETIYWARGVDDSGFTKAHGGNGRADLSADFNPFTVRDAARDGVNLDPRDGLSLQERFWLHTNLARWQQKIVHWMGDAVPCEAVRVSSAGCAYQGDLTRRNIYTEPYAMPCFPMRDVTRWHPGLEVGYVLDGRSGGEYWSGAAMLPWLLKEREMGRIALPNLECTGADDGQLLATLRAAYACGSRYATLYNWFYRASITDVLGAFARMMTAPALVVNAQATGGVAARREWTGPGDAFGVNRVTLTVARGSGRFVVRLSEAGAPNGGETAVWGAAAGGAARQVAVDLPSLFSVAPGARYVIAAEPAPGSDVAFASAADGQLAVRVEADIAMERARSMAIADPVDATDLLDSLERSHARGARTDAAAAALAAARQLLAAGRPLDAYRAGIRAEQLSLPALFDVAAPGGLLGPFPVRVRCSAGTVRVQVRALSARGVDLSVTSPTAQQVSVQWGGRSVTARVLAGSPVQIGLTARPAAPKASAKAAPGAKRQSGRKAAPTAAARTVPSANAKTSAGPARTAAPKPAGRSAR